MASGEGDIFMIRKTAAVILCLMMAIVCGCGNRAGDPVPSNSDVTNDPATPADITGTAVTAPADNSENVPEYFLRDDVYSIDGEMTGSGVITASPFSDDDFSITLPEECIGHIRYEKYGNKTAQGKATVCLRFYCNDIDSGDGLLAHVCWQDFGMLLDREDELNRKYNDLFLAKVGELDFRKFYYLRSKFCSEANLISVHDINIDNSGAYCVFGPSAFDTEEHYNADDPEEAGMYSACMEAFIDAVLSCRNPLAFVVRTGSRNLEMTDEERERFTKRLDEAKQAAASGDLRMEKINPMEYCQFVYDYVNTDTIYSNEARRLAGRYTYMGDMGQYSLGGTGVFSITLSEDGSFGYYETPISSHIGMGWYSINDDILELYELYGSSVAVRRFKVLDGPLSSIVLAFIADGSENFMFIKVHDGERFIYEPLKDALKSRQNDGGSLEMAAIDRNNITQTDLEWLAKQYFDFENNMVYSGTAPGEISLEAAQDLPDGSLILVLRNTVGALYQDFLILYCDRDVSILDWKYINATDSTSRIDIRGIHIDCHYSRQGWESVIAEGYIGIANGMIQISE